MRSTTSNPLVPRSIRCTMPGRACALCLCSAGATRPRASSAERLSASGRRLALLVDQLEEAWTLAEPSDRAAFFSALQALASAGLAVRIVATVRVDFLHRLEDLGELQAHPLVRQRAVTVPENPTSTPAAGAACCMTRT